MNYAQLILPEFLLILCGYLLCRFSPLNRSVWSQVDSLVYYFLFPVLLFQSIIKTPIDVHSASNLMGAGLLTGCCGIAMAYSLPYWPWLGQHLNRQDHAHEIVHVADASNLKVQMDLYHCQIVEGDLAMKIRQYLPTGRVGHLQIAGVPERHEPDLGELNYPYLFALIDSLGYTGVIGAEYRPRAATSAGLGWFQPYKKDR